MVQQVLGFTCGDILVSLDNVSAELIEEANSFSVDYAGDGSKPSIRKAIQLCKAEETEYAFMRSFMLVALGTMICPDSQNSLDLTLLNYLMRPAGIRLYDWATYAFDYIKQEVERFQQYIHSPDPAK